LRNRRGKLIDDGILIPVSAALTFERLLIETV
jgi:hypothetical protein